MAPLMAPLAGSLRRALSTYSNSAYDVPARHLLFPSPPLNEHALPAEWPSTALPPRPEVKPRVPNFSSGPCAKHPGWSPALLEEAATGRSHRSRLGKAKLAQAVLQTKELLNVPDDYRVAIIPGSATGAVEAAMWSLLGPRQVDMCYWEHFGHMWYVQATQELGLDVRAISTHSYGRLPDLSRVDKKNDCLFLFNGSASGVRVPHLEWIADDRDGLTICDATSAVFALDLGDWRKLDVTACSWQKGLGSEAAHGMLILSPRAIERLEEHAPSRPIPRIYRLAYDGKVDEALFTGNTVNTPSMLAVEDFLSALRWARSIGGADALYERNAANFAAVEHFVRRNSHWVNFLAEEPEYRSTATATLRLDCTPEEVKQMLQLLDAEGVARDINAFPSAPTGIRVWCGPTVERHDVEALTRWIEWAYRSVVMSERHYY